MTTESHELRAVLVSCPMDAPESGEDIVVNAADLGLVPTSSDDEDGIREYAVMQMRKEELVHPGKRIRVVAIPDQVFSMVQSFWDTHSALDAAWILGDVICCNCPDCDGALEGMRFVCPTETIEA